MTLSLEQEFGRILMLVLQDFQRRLDIDLEQQDIAGISRRHRAVFLHLARFGPSRSVDLAAAAEIRPQSMMAILNELEQLQLIERRPDPDDSRAKLIDITEQGREFIDQLSRSTTRVWDHYAEQLGQDELEQSFNGLKHLLTTLQHSGEHKHD